MLYSQPSNDVGMQSNSYRGTQLYNNQFFDYLSEQLPRKIKDMFRWCELVYYNAPIIVNGVRKLANYPITDFSYETTSEKIQERTKKFLLETQHRIMRAISSGNRNFNLMAGASACAIAVKIQHALERELIKTNKIIKKA